MNLLVIEDDKAIAQYVANGFIQHGYQSEIAEDGNKALEKINTQHYDLVILDLMLPQIDGMNVLEKIRSKDNPPPVIIVSAKHTVEDKVRALQEGSDDYLTKPFSFNELLARAQAILRRNNRQNKMSSYQFEDLVMNVETREVRRGDRKIELHPREFTLLQNLMSQPNKVLTKSQILEKVWGYDFDPQTNVVDVLICRLRNKVDLENEAKFIQTIRGIGYVLRKNDTAS